MIGRWSSLLRDRSGASAAEFALVLPFLLLMLFGIIDAGRYAYAFNRAEKATQVGARFAVVTDTIAPGLAAYDFTKSGIGAGDPIPVSALGAITCTSTTCTCTTSPCPAGVGAPTGVGATAMTALLTRMKQIDPAITDANVQLVYSGSGLGFAGDPTGMNVSPFVTVKLTNLKFKPITTLLLATINLGDAHTTLTAEDSVGSQSN